MTAAAMNTNIDTMDFTICIDNEQLTPRQQVFLQNLNTKLFADEEFLTANTLEDAWKASLKFIKTTYQQFASRFEELKTKFTNEISEILDGKAAINDDDLEMVVGGSPWTWIKDKAKAVGNWVVKHKKEIIGAAVFTLGCAVAAAVPFAAPAIAGAFALGAEATLAVGAGMVAAAGVTKMVGYGIYNDYIHI